MKTAEAYLYRSRGIRQRHDFHVQPVAQGTRIHDAHESSRDLGLQESIATARQDIGTDSDVTPDDLTPRA